LDEERNFSFKNRGYFNENVGKSVAIRDTLKFKPDNELTQVTFSINV
ncbi:1434_t:CDS:1, partial [Gigaspora margarita]